MKRNAMRMLVATALACATVLAGAPAFADNWSRQDVKWDMVYYPGGTTSPNSYYTNGDVRSIQVTHGPRRLKVTTSFTEFKSNTWEISVGAQLRVRTNTGHNFRFFADRSDNTSWTIQRDGKNFVCSGFSGSVDTVQSLVRWSIPRGCLGRPRFVRISMLGVYDDHSVAYFDDGLRNYAYWPGNLAYGPKLYRN